MIGPRGKLALGVIFILVVTAWMTLSGLQAGKAYYVTPDELLAMKDEAFDKRLRVAGYVQEGSIRREEGQLHFSMGVGDTIVQVVYVGRNPVPDTFKAGAEALVEGRYTPGNLFRADHIQAKCASKYEAELEQRDAGKPASQG